MATYWAGVLNHQAQFECKESPHVQPLFFTLYNVICFQSVHAVWEDARPKQPSSNAFFVTSRELPRTSVICLVYSPLEDKYVQLISSIVQLITSPVVINNSHLEDK